MNRVRKGLCITCNTTNGVEVEGGTYIQQLFTCIPFKSEIRKGYYMQGNLLNTHESD